MIERRREQKTLQALDDLISASGQPARGAQVRRAAVGRMGALQAERAPGRGARRRIRCPRPRASGSLTDASRPARIGRTGTIAPLNRASASGQCSRSSITSSKSGSSRTVPIAPTSRSTRSIPVAWPRSTIPSGRCARPRPRRTGGECPARQGGLRELAANTDGAVVLNTNDVKGGVARMMTDLNAYYLMRYYSSNTNLDGRFRRITVRVSRPGVRVRARTGYLAPTETEARAAGVAPRPVSLPAGVEPIVRTSRADGVTPRPEHRIGLRARHRGAVSAHREIAHRSGVARRCVGNRRPCADQSTSGAAADRHGVDAGHGRADGHDRAM